MFQLQMSQGLTLRQRLSQKLELEPMTESVFIVSEAYLTKSAEASYHQKLLGLFSSKDTMENYKSICDMLLCRVFPEYQKACFNYYRRGGKQLRDVAFPEEIEMLDKALYFSLKMANIVVTLDIYVESRKVFIENCRNMILKCFPYSMWIAEKHSSCTLFLSDKDRESLGIIDMVP